MILTKWEVSVSFSGYISPLFNDLLPMICLIIWLWVFILHFCLIYLALGSFLPCFCQITWIWVIFSYFLAHSQYSTLLPCCLLNKDELDKTHPRKQVKKKLVGKRKSLYKWYLQIALLPTCVILVVLCAIFHQYLPHLSS